MCVADAAQGFPALADGVRLLCPLETRWDLASDSRYPPLPGAKPSRAERTTQCRDRRQPVGENDRKRGAHGYDAGKKINGRKRHILVDTMGLLLGVVVHAANIQDRDGAKLLLQKVKGCFPRIQLVWADGGYAGKLVQWVADACGWVLEIVRRRDDLKGFHVLPRRWVVERTFGWLGRYRRLSKDYEYHTDTSETMIRIAMIQLMLHRLAPVAQPGGT
jgi:transposase